MVQAFFRVKLKPPYIPGFYCGTKRHSMKRRKQYILGIFRIAIVRMGKIKFTLLS